MKNSISYILSFILMIIFTLSMFFIIGQKELRSSVIVNRLEKDNYYYKIYGNILSKIDDYVINEDIMKSYKDYLSIDIVKSDIKRVINNIYSNKDLEISRYDDFYKIIKGYSNDTVISQKYAEGINKIYRNNLFPTRELTLIHKVYIPSTDVLFYFIVAMLLCLAISIGLFIINGNFKFHTISLLASAIIFILPNIFIKFFGIFDNFVYTNEYYTEILLSIVKGTISSSCLLGLVIIILIFAYRFIVENYNFLKLKIK